MAVDNAKKMWECDKEEVLEDIIMEFIEYVGGGFQAKEARLM